MCLFFFFIDTATTEIYTLSLHDALPILRQAHADGWFIVFDTLTLADDRLEAFYDKPTIKIGRAVSAGMPRPISYAVFCLKKKKIMYKHLTKRRLQLTEQESNVTNATTHR